MASHCTNEGEKMEQRLPSPVAAAVKQGFKTHKPPQTLQDHKRHKETMGPQGPLGNFTVEGNNLTPLSLGEEKNKKEIEGPIVPPPL